MANSIFIQHDPTDDWQLLVTAFIEHCRASHAIQDPTVVKGSFEYITPNGRAFLQLSVPDKQWSQMYPAFKDWAGLNSHHSAWIEHGRIWISDDTSHHLRDCQRVETDGKLNWADLIFRHMRDNNVLIRSGEARLVGWSRNMLYPGFNICLLYTSPSPRDRG